MFRFLIERKRMLLILLVILLGVGVDAYMLVPNRRSMSLSTQNDMKEMPIMSMAKNTRPVSTRLFSSKQQEEEQGSVLGAALLFAGTAIGAGMLALPAETASAGYIPSLSAISLCWAFTYITALVTLEASWTVSKDQDLEEAGFLSITRDTLGPIGEIVTAILFWFLLTSIVVAYTSEGGELIVQFVQEQGMLLSSTLGSILFMVFFASLAIFGTQSVDLVNRFLVTGLIGSFVGLLGIGLPQIDSDILFSHSDWSTVYPQVISIGILAFGAQNVVPTILEFLGGNPTRTQRAILLGSLIPLIMYFLWESVFLGIVPSDPTNATGKMQVVTALGDTGGTIVQELVEVFSACAIGSSMAGASVSLVDFFQDALVVTRGKTETLSSTSTTERLVAAALALGPPLGLACAYPDAFLSVLENAGLIGGVSLYGLLPALAVIQLRKSRSSLVESMPGRLLGGAPALYILVTLSFALLLPDLIELGQRLLSS